MPSQELVPRVTQQAVPRIQTSLPSDTPVPSRTRAAQTSLMQATAREISQSPTGNAGSKLHNMLEKTLHVACYIENKNTKRICQQCSH